MTEDKTTPEWPQPQYYQFGQDAPSAPDAPPAPPAPSASEDESTGVEDVAYDKVTMAGAPDNPKSAAEVVERGVVNVANPPMREQTAPPTPEATQVSPEEQARIDATAGSDRQIKTLKDWLDANPQETEEQRKKRERREKSAKIVSAVSDGFRAMSNLFFTSQYAPNMYNHEKSSALTAQQTAIDKAKAEREKKRDQYLNFALKLGDVENQRAATLRELEAQQEKMKLAREKAAREQEAHGWQAALQPDKLREQAGRATKAEQEAITAKAEADYAPQLQKAKLATERARKGSYDASTANSLASAAAHGLKEFSAWDERGKEHKFKTKDSAEAFAKQHGTWKEEDIVSTSSSETDSDTQGKSSTTRTETKKGGHAGRPSPTGGGGKKSPTA